MFPQFSKLMNKVINGKYIYIKDNTNKKKRIFLKGILKK